MPVRAQFPARTDQEFCQMTRSRPVAENFNLHQSLATYALNLPPPYQPVAGQRGVYQREASESHQMGREARAAANHALHELEAEALRRQRGVHRAPFLRDAVRHHAQRGLAEQQVLRPRLGAAADCHPAAQLNHYYVPGFLANAVPVFRKRQARI